MKQRINWVLFCLMLLTTLWMGTAYADRFGDANTDEPPVEVLLHIQKYYPAYLMEDYIAIRSTPEGDYGFALLSQNQSRVLLGYRDDGAGMVYWLRNAGAVPQGGGYAFFRRHSADGYISQGNTDATYADALGFDVIRIDPAHEEYWAQSVSYHWRSGSFRLYAWMDRDDGMERAYVTDSGVSYYDFTNARKLGRVAGTVQRELRYVSFSALPKTRAQALRSLSTAPDIPAGGLTPQSIRFTGGRKFGVYQGPGEGYGRGGKGKASVSTNDWIQVFGCEDGWIMIQYAISSDRMRIGWISESALPEGAAVATLRFAPVTAYTTRAVTVTDDPLFSGAAVLTLPQGVRVGWLATMGEWAYIESSSGDLLRGFVPADALTRDVVFRLEDHPDATLQRHPLQGTLTITGSGRVTLAVTAAACTPNGREVASFALYDMTTGRKIVMASASASGFYGQGEADAAVYDLLIVPVDATGKEDRSQALSIRR